MTVILLPASDIWQFWEQLRPHFITAAGTTNGKVGVDDLLRDAVNNVFQVWVVWNVDSVDAILATRILEYPKMRTLSLQYCAGKNMKKWMPTMESELRRYAQYNNCQVVEIVGRFGWHKLFKTATAKSVHLEIAVEPRSDPHNPVLE